MTKHSGELAAQVAGHLATDEVVLVAAVVEHGSAAKISAALFGGPGVSSMVGPNSKQIRGTARLVPVSGRTIWALTNQRMLFFVCTFGNVMADLLSAIPIGDVAAVEARRAKVALGKLDLTFRDGSHLQLDLHTDDDADVINQAAAELLPDRPQQPSSQKVNWSHMAIERAAEARQRGRRH